MNDIIENMDLSTKQKTILSTAISADTFDGCLTKEVVTAITADSTTEVSDLQLALLPLVASYARVPISDFHVGAVAEGESGNLYFGTNLEFTHNSLASTLHAEQAAVANTFSYGEEGIKSIAINAAPCGLCRQFLNELSTATTLKIILPGRKPSLFLDCLPEAFGPQDLGVEGVLLSHQDNKLAFKQHSEDKLQLAALEAANMSYAPYTFGYAGVALLLNNGKISIGPYAENVAYNPSLNPMLAALVRVAFTKDGYDNIARAVLVECDDAIISQKEIASSILQAVAPAVKLDVLLAVSAT